jgi:hypothetical protein
VEVEDRFSALMLDKFVSKERKFFLPISNSEVLNIGHLEKLLVSDKSHAKHGKTHLFAKGLFSGLVGLGEKFEFFEVPLPK